MMQPGQRFGNCKLIKKVGGGGFGDVWYGETDSGEPRAVKILRPEHVSSPRTVQRFEYEWRILKKIPTHPNIIRAYEYARGPGGVPYISMHWGANGSLVEQRAKLDPDSLKRVVLQILSALAQAHKMNIIHRDMKPGNVLFDADNVAKVVDWGIAKPLHETDSGEANVEFMSLTQAGRPVGTPIYMAPEQFIPDIAPLGPGTDIYALGIMLYEIVCGKPPFTMRDESDLVSIGYAHANLPPMPPLDRGAPISESLNKVILKAIAKHPSQRYRSAEEMARAVEAADFAPARTAQGAPQTPQQVEADAVAEMTMDALTKVGAGNYTDAGRIFRQIAAKSPANEREAFSKRVALTNFKQIVGARVEHVEDLKLQGRSQEAAAELGVVLKLDPENEGALRLKKELGVAGPGKLPSLTAAALPAALRGKRALLAAGAVVLAALIIVLAIALPGRHAPDSRAGGGGDQAIGPPAGEAIEPPEVVILYTEAMLPLIQAAFTTDFEDEVRSAFGTSGGRIRFHYVWSPGPTLVVKHGEQTDRLVRQMCELNDIAIVENGTTFFGLVNGVFDGVKPTKQNWVYRSNPNRMGDERGIKEEAAALVRFLTEHSPDPDRIDLDGFEARLRGAHMK